MMLVAACVTKTPPPRPMRVVTAAVTVAVLAHLAGAVDRSKFRKCSEAGFCRRHRERTTEPEVSVVYYGH